MGCDDDPGTVGGDAVTTLLYHSDSYLRAMDATVTRVEGERVALDRTVYYAQSGGQPADHGTLSWPEGAARVVDVRRSGDEILHQLAGPVPVAGAAPARWCRISSPLRRTSTTRATPPGQESVP